MHQSLRYDRRHDMRATYGERVEMCHAFVGHTYEHNRGTNGNAMNTVHAGRTATPPDTWKIIARKNRMLINRPCRDDDSVRMDEVEKILGVHRNKRAFVHADRLSVLHHSDIRFRCNGPTKLVDLRACWTRCHFFANRTFIDEQHRRISFCGSDRCRQPGHAAPDDQHIWMVMTRLTVARWYIALRRTDSGNPSNQWFRHRPEEPRANHRLVIETHGKQRAEMPQRCKKIKIGRRPRVLASDALSRGGHRAARAFARLAIDGQQTIWAVAGKTVQSAWTVIFERSRKDPHASAKKAAYTQHPRPAYFKDAPEVMGRSVRTVRYRYTEWRDFKTGELVASELYDHERDPLETVNVAADSANADAIVECQRLYRIGFGQ